MGLMKIRVYTKTFAFFFNHTSYRRYTQTNNLTHIYTHAQTHNTHNRMMCVQGAQRDGEGNLVNWWAKQTKQNYLNKAQCIIGGLIGQIDS